MDRGMLFNEMRELGKHLWVSSVLGIENEADSSKVTLFMPCCVRAVTLRLTRSHPKKHS